MEPEGTNRSDTQGWLTDGRPGVRYQVLRRHSKDGATLITEFAAGSRSGWHVHPGGEELSVLEWRCDLSGVNLGPGDYAYTPPGAGHDLLAIETTRVLVVLPVLPVYEDATLD